MADHKKLCGGGGGGGWWVGWLYDFSVSKVQVLVDFRLLDFTLDFDFRLWTWTWTFA